MKTNVRKLFWRIAQVGILGAAVSLMALMLTFRATTLRLAPLNVGPLPFASPPDGMSISALPTGYYDSPAALTFRGGNWSETRHLAATALLIRHPLGNILIDTGFGGNVDEKMKLLPFMQRSPHTKGTPVVAQLASGGIHLSDLAGVIPTHVHWDHIGALDDLRGVPLFENKAGRNFISSRSAGTEVINSMAGIIYKSYDFDGKAYLGFPHSHDLFGDGSVVIVPAPGHTPDSVVVFITLPSRTRYALIGDIAFQEDGVTLPAEKPWLLRLLIGEDRAEVLNDIARIRSLHEKFPQIRVIPAHDMSSFRTLPIFPAHAG